MGWAKFYIEKLQKGETVQFRPSGNSMRGKIESGQLCTVEPVKSETKLEVDDVVLCRVSGSEYLHLIKAIRQDKNQVKYQIGNNRGGINGWISAGNIYGKCVKVEP